jgi:DNA-binding GntR family transcriptional regulator
LTASKLSASEYVYNCLKDEVMFLELLPGQTINEVETSNRFNVSRTPVRDAFNRLESEGLIDVKPKYGTFVTLIDIDEISDMMYMREKLELAVIKDIKYVSKSQEVKINVLLLQQHKILNSDLDELEMAQKFLEADNEFHAAIFNLDNKESIWKRIAEDNPHYNRLRLLANRENRNSLDKIHEDHTKIIKAIISKDYELLEEYYNKHIYEGIENLTEIVSKYNEYFK